MTKDLIQGFEADEGASRLLHSLRDLIQNARRQAAIAVNIGLTVLYWRLGDRIRREVLGSERAGYGEQIVATLSHQLAAEFGRGFERTNLTRMMKFAEMFPYEEIVATLSHQLSWSHFRELLPLDKPIQREFYAEMCRVEGWSVRTLRGRIDSMLYERTALSRKPDELARPGRNSPPCTRKEHARSCSTAPNFVTSLRIDSARLAMVPRLRTSPSGSATARAIVSAWTSKPKNRNFSFMTGSFPLVALSCAA